MLRWLSRQCIQLVCDRATLLARDEAIMRSTLQSSHSVDSREFGCHPIAVKRGLSRGMTHWVAYSGFIIVHATKEALGVATIVAFLSALPAGSSFAQEQQEVPAVAVEFENTDASSTPSGLNARAGVDTQAGIEFHFQGTPWRDVISWLAEESGSALHVGELPTGSFTYEDQNEFTPQQAIDRVNLFLLPQGYAIVRSGSLMSVVNLSDPRSTQQLDALAPLVPQGKLDDQPDHDVVKCIFSLGELKPEDAIQELSAMNLMTTPSVFEKTKRLMVVDSVAKLKNVREILAAFQPGTMDNGTVVKSFSLQHVEAEDILVVARPHLGLATDEMIGIDVSLSADLQGKNIFVTGVEDKVAVIERLVESIDKPQADMSLSNTENVLKAHQVETGNLETVYNVLQTLLAGQQVRISTDSASSSIVALATPEIQTQIEATIRQLKGSEAEFEVISLRWADPYYVVGLLEQMLDLPDPMIASSSKSRVAKDDTDDAPRIDADPDRRRLFVRGKRYQIDQIKKIVEGLDVSTTTEAGTSMRVLPLHGNQAESVLSTAAKFWTSPNPIIYYDSASESISDVKETIVSEGAVNSQEGTVKGTSQSAMNAGMTISRSSDAQITLTAASPLRLEPNARLLSGKPSSRAEAIKCQLTTRGLLMQCEDVAALDEFEEHLQTIAGPLDSTPAPPTVFYLTYAKSDDAIRMLAELLDGGEAVSDGQSDSLINGFMSSSSDSFLSSIVTSRDGTMTLINGSITIVADPRLNRLIAQGTTTEISRIEGYLRIVDRDNSLTEVRTEGVPHVIELEHANASEVADAIREAFANQVGGKSSSGAAKGSGNDANDKRAEAAAAAESAKGKNAKGKPAKPAAASAKDLEPKMLIAVHEPSNSLIVTAAEGLYVKVEQLAKALDGQSEQTIEVFTPVNGPAMESMLRQVILGFEGTTERPTASRSRPTSSRTTASSRGK